MFEHVVLLTGPGETAILSARLRSCRPGLDVLPVGNRDDLAALSPETLAASRLIAFTTPVIVPAKVLGLLGYGAYNFHPGSPEYPGSSPAQFALYDRAPSFGATVHRMVEAVDAGPIVAVARFEVKAGTTLQALEMAAFQHLARLFWDLSPTLAADAAPLPELPVRWSGRRSTRRSTEAMCSISPDIDEAELQRRIAAFGRNPFGLAPTINLHGYRFRLDADAAEEAPVRTENSAVPSAA